MSAIKLDPTSEPGQERSVRITAARPDDRDLLLSFLERDPVANLFHLGVVTEHGVEGKGRASYQYWLAWADGELIASTFASSTGMASAVGDPAGAAAMGRHLSRNLRLRLVVGERTACDGLWEAWGDGEARLNRAHRLFELNSPTLSEPALRLARNTEIPEIVTLAAAMRLEELGRTVSDGELEEFAARVAHRVDEERVYVLEQDGHIVFKADVGTRCHAGAQVEGVYTVPALRGQGIASRCVSEMGRRLLPSWSRVTLHVFEENHPALRAYERAGFVAARPFRLILVD